MEEKKEEKIIKTVSFSEYSTYLTCPHKWYLNYCLKLPGDTGEELIFGSAVHNTIESILTNKNLLRFYKFDKEKIIKDVFSDCLKQELSKVNDVSFLQRFNKTFLANVFLKQATALIINLDFFKTFKDYEVIHVEYKLDNFTIHETDEYKIIYKGFVDLILKHKVTGIVLILDWKTSKKPWDIKQKMKEKDDFWAQLCLYKKFYSIVTKTDFKKIQTKFYNFPREEPTKQSPYEGNLTQEYTDHFFNKFKNTAIQMYEHKQKPENFAKAKHITSHNFCFRCKFNTPTHCNDVDEFQKIDITC